MLCIFFLLNALGKNNWQQHYTTNSIYMCHTEVKSIILINVRYFSLIFLLLTSLIFLFDQHYFISQSHSLIFSLFYTHIHTLLSLSKYMFAYLVLYQMVAHLTMRTYGGNQAFRFVEGIWLHRKSRQIRNFFRKRPILLHTCTTCSELPPCKSTMDKQLDKNSWKCSTN